jgi:hypothetical protein
MIPQRLERQLYLYQRYTLPIKLRNLDIDMYNIYIDKIKLLFIGNKLVKLKFVNYYTLKTHRI